jgi:hypothetical protein
LPAGAPFLPLAGGTVTGSGVTATTGIFGGVANPAMRDTSHYTWVGQAGLTYYDLQSFAAFYTVPGFNIACSAAVKASDQIFNGTGNLTANIGFAAFAMSDSTSPNAGNTWAFYGSTRRYAGAPTTLGAEFGICNLAPTVELNAYISGAYGSTIGLWIQSGGDPPSGSPTQYPCSAAIGIIKTGGTWAKGIVFGHDALASTPAGTFIATSMAPRTEMQWIIDGNNTRGGFIRCDAGTVGTGIEFDVDGVFHIVSADPAETVRFSVAANGAITMPGPVTASGGLHLGSAFAASTTDLTKHVDLYGGTYGFDVTSGQLNYVAPASAAHVFTLGTTGVGYINSTGLNGLPVGAQSANTGTFTALVATGAVTAGTALLIGPSAANGYIDTTGINYIAIGQSGVAAGAFTTIALNAATTGPTIRAGTGAPSGTAPNGSLWIRTDGAAGAHLYVNQTGGSTWAAVAGV